MFSLYVSTGPFRRSLVIGAFWGSSSGQEPHLHGFLLPLHGDGTSVLQVELRVRVLRRLQTPAGSDVMMMERSLVQVQCHHLDPPWVDERERERERERDPLTCKCTLRRWSCPSLRWFPCDSWGWPCCRRDSSAASSDLWPPSPPRPCGSRWWSGPRDRSKVRRAWHRTQLGVRTWVLPPSHSLLDEWLTDYL